MSQKGPKAIETDIDRKDQRLSRLLVTFELPENAKPAESLLAKDFVRLDHRSLNTLPPHSRERTEIRDLLINVAVFLQNRQVEAARSLLQQAEAVYGQHLQARNRLRYLLGMLLGITAMVLLGVSLFAASPGLEGPLPPRSILFVVLFAGMGAVTSVLTRLSDIDLRDQTSEQMVLVSGAARPVTAVFFALVVSLALVLRIVDIHVGVATGDAVPLALLLVAAFLCGFSERFAQDVLARVGGEGVDNRDAECPKTPRPIG